MNLESQLQNMVTDESFLVLFLNVKKFTNNYLIFYIINCIIIYDTN